MSKRHNSRQTRVSNQKKKNDFPTIDGYNKRRILLTTNRESISSNVSVAWFVRDYRYSEKKHKKNPVQYEQAAGTQLKPILDMPLRQSGRRRRNTSTCDASHTNVSRNRRRLWCDFTEHLPPSNPWAEFIDQTHTSRHYANCVVVQFVCSSNKR